LFSIKLHNDCREVLKEVILVYDDRASILPLIEHKQEGTINVVVLNRALAPDESAVVQCVYRPERPGDHGYRFFAAASGIRSAFAVARCRVIRTLRIESRMSRMINDMTRQVVHCTVRTDLDEVSVLGIIGRAGVLLKTIQMGKTTIARGESLSIIAMTQQETETKVEPWRVEIMGNARYALLLHTKNAALHAQYNFAFDGREEEAPFKIDMTGTFVKGQTIKCTVIGTEGKECFVRGRPIVQLNPGSGTSAARWVGSSTRQLATRNGFKAEFLIAAPLGMFRVDGFEASPDATFAQSSYLSLFAVFQVVAGS
jgi:hypothetical protein